MPLAEKLAESASRSRDFSDLVEMNGSGCGNKQARVLFSYDGWGSSTYRPERAGRKVDGLKGRRASSVSPSGV